MITANGFAGVFVFAYGCAVVAVTIYLIVLAARFVKSHERIASALERIARNNGRSGP